MNQRYFIVIDGCPCFADVGPYIEICLQDANATATSIYRGDDARAILNAHGHHSQSQLYHATPAERVAWGILGQPDAPGHSSHELYSDGNRFYGVPDGQRLAWWQQGFDVISSESDAVIAAAARHGWRLARPYSSGVEVHHLNFASKPSRPRVVSRDWTRLWTIRLRYPRS